MNIKLLAMVSVLCLVGAGIFFVSQKSNNPKQSLPKPDIVSQVSEIKAVQTNPETGEIEYTLTAKSLIQTANGTAVLNDVIMDWTPSKTADKPQEHYTIKATSGTLDDKTGDFVFKDGFEFVRHENETTAPIIITGGVLTGNQKTKLIGSQDPLRIVQNGNEFNSQGFGADLNTQVYDFYRITMSFTAPTRKDTPLF